MFGVQARQVNESSHAFEVDRQPDHFVKLSIGVIRLAIDRADCSFLVRWRVMAAANIGLVG